MATVSALIASGQIDQISRQVPIITLALLSIAITELIRWAERRISPWMDQS